MIVLSIEEAIEAFRERAQDWLAPMEEFERSKLQVPKRHDEWLAGRIAAKRAAQRATGLPFCRLVIRRSTEAHNRGQPELRIDGDGPRLGFISISHSSGYAAAAFDTERLGIDIERIIMPEPSLVDTALSAVERARLGDLSDAERPAAFTRSWCAKEAYSKWLGRGFAVPLHELDPEMDARVQIELGVLSHDPSIIWARAESREKLRPRWISQSTLRS